ncbi:DNA polymerase III subunit delta [Pseudoroseicyclus tamaricis]|uniref:DNA-directed DNA polymerase n=1 Tax=Pseudoroseicyclus tamaricis TaxID=2705421 RepID=A0A6B2JXG0_9RHOB|nr:DNA polymerase III subunit delta [Pseudoroseicyclus tamaricis]NDV02555.1 DNA polymerase III subunit delta [Pseudoroseicyclus tamaricis]
MKLSTRDARGWLARPDPRTAGALIYGADPMRVADARQRLVAALIGPEGEAEMRLTRIQAAELRKDGAMLDDAMRSQGFFPGPRVALVEEAGDGLAPVVKAALEARAEGDAHIVVTAGQLTARSALRKLFEGSKTAACIALYDDPPGPEEISEMLAAAGLRDVTPEARADLADLARALEPGDFRQTMEKLGLYKFGDSAPVSPEDITAVAPLSAEADLDELLAAVSEGRAEAVPGLVSRLEAQGTGAVALSIAALRHFRQLHAAASDPEGPAKGIGRAKPPIWGPRRDAMIRYAGRWGKVRLETAIGLLIEADMTLRSSSRAPGMSLFERLLIRLAMMGRDRA